MDSTPHPFAKFIAILARGKTRTRSLTIGEAEEAMGMILDGAVLPEQLGAFLMLLRVKEESPEEIAGFVRAARARMVRPEGRPRVDLDWSSYAGKSRQLPWYLLAALALAGGGYRVVMHGTEGHTPARLYTSEVLASLGLRPAASLAEALAMIEDEHFAYVPLEVLSPTLKRLIGLRPILGLRSPVHTLARLLDPFTAGAVLQSVVHPGYLAIHEGAGTLLGIRRLAVFRGEGGEIERRPSKPCEFRLTVDGVTTVERWPPLLPDPQAESDAVLEPARLAALWRGDDVDTYAEAAVTGTIALALRLLGAAATPDEAPDEVLAAARRLWQARRPI